MKGDIHRFIFSTSSSLYNIGEPRYRQNNAGYPILRIEFQAIFDYPVNPIPCIVLPISRLPYIAQKTNCTENVPMDVSFNLRYVPAKEQRKPKFSAEIFLSAEIPFPLKGNRNQYVCFRFWSSRNRNHKTNFGFNRNFGRNIVSLSSST